MELDIIKSLIDTDRKSLKKQEMTEGINYYNGINDILDKDFRVYYVKGVRYIDRNKSNFRIANNYQKKLTDQETGYILGKPVAIVSEDKELQQKVVDLLGEKRHDIFTEFAKGAINKGYEGLHSFRDEDGNFDYTVMPGQELIFIYDTSYQQILLNVVRYYYMEWLIDGEARKVIRVEVWDKETVTFYQETKNGEFEFIVPGMFGIDENPRWHWQDYYVDPITEMKKDIENHGWGEIPIVKLSNNTEENSSLRLYKSYVDAMDIVSSGFVNDLKDVQLAIWVLRGYEGEDLSDFMHNLMQFKAIKLSTDDKSSAEPKTMDIPKEARVALLDWLEKKIYQIGQGVNETDLQGGSITNVAIKAMYAGLDIKANILITKMKRSLQEFMFFVVEFINDRDGTSYDYKDLNFIFNKSMIFNELEIVQMLQASVGLISNQTIRANHPLVKDEEAEAAQMALEQKERIDLLGGGMGFEE